MTEQVVRGREFSILQIRRIVTIKVVVPLIPRPIWTPSVTRRKGTYLRSQFNIRWARRSCLVRAVLLWGWDIINNNSNSRKTNSETHSLLGAATITTSIKYRQLALLWQEGMQLLLLLHYMERRGLAAEVEESREHIQNSQGYTTIMMGVLFKSSH